MHVVAGLRQAALLWLLLGAASAAVAGVWTAARGGAYDERLGLVLMLVAGAACVTGGSSLSRDVTNEARAWLGAGPDRADPYSGKALTPFGVFLLVGLPLFVTGGLLLG